MEALRNLEQLHSALSLIQSHKLSSNHHDSDRFLADFLLFMAKPCGTLDMENKYNLISQILHKISPSIIDDALLCLIGEDQQNATELCLGDESDLSLIGTDIEDMPMIGLDAMQRANSTLEDFCRSYFMFHGMDVHKPEYVFKYLPILSFTESYIYQLDSLNEDVLCTSMAKMQGKNKRLKDHFVKVIKTGAFRPLIILLERHGLLTERIRAELSYGEDYWALERKLCRALVNKKEILIEDVMRAIHLKSFDYRVLNMLLYQLQETQVNETHMEFLSVSEFLVEISDDLFDYEEDVMENSFNVLRMFIGVYGASLAPIMLAKRITEAENKYEQLLKSLDPELSMRYKRRCEEATREGGHRVGHSLGTWSIPPVIADEALYRSRSTTEH